MLWALCWSLSSSSLVALSSSEAVLCGGDGWGVELMWAVDAAVIRVVCARVPLYRRELFARGGRNHCRTVPLSLGVVVWLARVQSGG